MILRVLSARRHLVEVSADQGRIGKRVEYKVRIVVVVAIDLRMARFRGDGPSWSGGLTETATAVSLSTACDRHASVDT